MNIIKSHIFVFSSLRQHKTDCEHHNNVKRLSKNWRQGFDPLQVHKTPRIYDIRTKDGVSRGKILFWCND